ncbi:hypothetical protein SAMN04487831_103301 [Pseudobutyrivibrio sp. UC1225]|uniref:hypothetical protein n=1 Tax=Pseudobutyrivibrio sp. UC1225 TaxID=1798185 RepID=UPI0008EDB80F|nr:hypothetical protein [Pseudobutyrivibrio sp. UC1225]SFN78867.1 hypothetical protein SAMN04487831_103301 [Pseudobutyrivibrio sp. UC1225]
MRKIVTIARINLIALVIICFGGCGKDKGNNDIFTIPQTAEVLDTSISEIYGDADAIVTIISDDGFYQTAENLDKIFGERELKCTVAGAIKFVEPDLESWEQLLENDTIDLVSHSYNHIKMATDTEISKDENALKHEIVDADQWYEEKLGKKQIVFVCPENTMCDLGYKILEENDFWAVRRGNRGYNPLSPKDGTNEGDWMNLMVQGIQDEGTDLSVRNGWVDTAISDNVWLIEMWHNVMLEDDGGYQTILISDAEKHMDYIKEKSDNNDIWVATFDEAVKYIREKQNINVYAYIDDSDLHVYGKLNKKNMSSSTFNQPLTVHITIPDDMNIEKSGNSIRQDGNELVINIIPNEELVMKIRGAE